MLLNPGTRLSSPSHPLSATDRSPRWRGVPVYVELKAENQFRLTPEQLKAAITPRTKALVLPFPSNPTGGIMERQDLEALAQVLRDTEIMVVSDEIYAELTYGQRHVSMANLEEMYDRTIVVNGFSKSHAMTGWRMGYVCAPKPYHQQLTKLHQFGIMSAPTVSQYAAIEAMRNGDRDIEHMREEYDSRRRYLVENLRRIGLSCFEPKGAFYVFPDIRSTGLTSNEFCERFLREERVAVIPGSAFGPGGEGLRPGLLCRLDEGYLRGHHPDGQLPDQPAPQRREGLKMNSNRILFEKITNRIEKRPALVCLWDEPHVIPAPCGSGDHTREGTRSGTSGRETERRIDHEYRMPGYGGGPGPGDLDRLCRGQRYPGAEAHHPGRAGL